MQALLDFFVAHDIPYQKVEHEPVFTTEQAAVALVGLPGAPTKNLFLRDDKGKRHFLVTTVDSKKVDMKALQKLIGAKGLGFASADRLRKHLGVEPGSVTLLALINDPALQVEVFIDKDVWDFDQVQCHPLVNTATVVVTRDELERFIGLTGHGFQVIELPAS